MNRRLLLGFFLFVVPNEIYSFRVIIPGTKWCGEGNIAANYSDLGIHSVTDMCCRDHDHCEDYIRAGEICPEKGLYNDASYSRLSCDCDQQFYDCLKKSTDPSAYIVGESYFNALPEKCFAFRHPATCVKYDDDCAYKSQSRCLEYTYDTSLPEKWQWFEMQRFSRK